MAFVDKEKSKAYYKKWREENKKYLQEYAKKYRAEHKEEHRKYSRKYEAEHREHIREIHKRYPKICEWCKKNFKAQNKIQRFCSHRCAGASFKTISYKTYRIGNKSILFHRFVMEQHLRRKLGRNEVVHHINGIKQDNRIENLMLFRTDSKHIAHHRKTQPEKYPGK
jgi:endogenous inhibitor of DNA gyrase (YacG/DUF329 family)